MLFSWEFILICFIIFFVICIWHVKNRREHPPGPLGFPILGMIPFRTIELLFSKWIKKRTDAEIFQIYNEKYGPIWSIEFGRQRVVTLSSWSLISDAFIGNPDLFSGRPKNNLLTFLGIDKGIIFADGEIWRNNRNLALKSLRELGMGKKKLNDMISDESDSFISYLQEKGLYDMNLSDALAKGVSNVVIRLVFEERNNYDDEHFDKYVKDLRLMTRSDVAFKKLMLFPSIFKYRVVKELFPDVKEYLDAHEFSRDFITDKCKMRAKEQEGIIQAECIFDYLFRLKSDYSSSLSDKDRNELKLRTIWDLFDAAIDTTSNLLSFCCLMLGRYDDVQNDLRNEIRSVSDTHGDINIEQRKNCPKILSFVDEVQRFCSIIPNVQHRVLKECVFHGYKLYPSDVIVGDFANLFMNPDLFDDPKTFNAYRFLDESGTKYCPSKYLIPFGIGKRSCLGEGIAVVQIFLFLTKILKTFKIILTEETSNNFDKIVCGLSGLVHGSLDHSMRLECVL